MRLTRAERHLLEEGTDAQRKAMEILLTVGRLADAPRLVPITSAHVSGASYKMIGDPGLEFLEDFAQTARVSVPTTVNPLGTDLAQWQALGIPPEFAEKQARIARAYETMAVRPSFSCTPYLLGARPAFGEHVAWAESSAVCFANSVLGARTNREGGPAALAAAIVGATPEYGLHVDGGREPTVIVNVRTKPRGIDRTPPRIPVWVFTSRIVRDANPEAVGIIERHGGRVLADTCLEVTLLEHRFGTVATPSGKGAYYLPSLCKQKVIFDDVEALLERYT